MRRREIFALAVVGMIIVAPAAITIAGDWHRGGSSGTYGPAESHPSMGSGSHEAPSDQGSLEYQEALETGKLPSRERGTSSVSGSPGGEEIRTVEAGGLWFRQGIDTGP